MLCEPIDMVTNSGPHLHMGKKGSSEEEGELHVLASFLPNSRVIHAGVIYSMDLLFLPISFSTHFF